MKKKIRVAILFGGKSAEHEVSLQSAKNIIEALDKEKYEVVLIGIDKKGRWFLNNQASYLLNAENPKLISLHKSNRALAVLPGDIEKQIIDFEKTDAIGKIDVAFPILHGKLGEDGAIQGLLKTLNIPFVGADVLGSAVGMDKDVMKRLLREAGIPIANFICVKNPEDVSFDQAKKKLGLPMFVKPANQGSSFGVHKVRTKNEFYVALADALSYDSLALVEEFIDGKEIECSVLGNENPEVSVVGEIVPHHEFYNYQSKYVDSEVLIPAPIPQKIAKLIQGLAIKAYTALRCEGMARVDSFLTKDNNVFINEINTLPGFTKMSVYPKLWEASGIPYKELIERLIQLAIVRNKQQQKLKTSF